MQTNVNKNGASLIKWLLTAGIVSAPFFYVITIIQAFTRSGFDIRIHAISSLTLGDLGWIQSTNFIITGLFALLAAIGFYKRLRNSNGGKWGVLMIGLYGIGMMMAGLFRPDPGLGFPAGAPAGMPKSMSNHAVLHSMAFFIAFICLIAATIIFARTFASLRDSGWRNYSLTTAILAPLLIILGISIPSWIGVIMGSAGIIAFGWVSVLSAKISGEVSKD